MYRIDAIAETIERDGLTVAGAVGQIRPHPLLAERRQAQLALGRLLDGLGLSEPVADESRSFALARHDHCLERRRPARAVA